MVINSSDKSLFEIRDSTGKEFKEIYDNQGRLLFKNWNEIQGSPPITFRGYGKNLTECRIYGNTVQNGTPSPEAPVDVVGSGVRTGNVMPAGEKKTVEVNGVTFSSDGNGRYRISGTASRYSNVLFNLVSGFTTPTSVSNGGQGTLSFFNNQSTSSVTLIFYNGLTNVDDWKMTPRNRVSTTYNAIGNKYVDRIMLAVDSGATVDMTITPEFTDDGILPSWYEPYGYKLPLTVNGTEYPIYLGQVETTRKVKKLVLTGEETGWIKRNSPDNTYQISYPSNAVTYIGMCSHFMNGGSQLNNIVSGEAYFGLTGFGARYDTVTTLDAWKSYIAAQYAAGTPVTVWYVLAEPETAIVNEPIQKIGDYSDELSIAGVPTINGINTISADTTIQPSEMYLKGKIKPVT